MQRISFDCSDCFANEFQSWRARRPQFATLLSRIKMLKADETLASLGSLLSEAGISVNEAGSILNLWGRVQRDKGEAETLPRREKDLAACAQHLEEVRGKLSTRGMSPVEVAAVQAEIADAESALRRAEENVINPRLAQAAILAGRELGLLP